MKERSSFIMYTDTVEQLDMLTDNQLGKLTRALAKFAATGEEPVFRNQALQVAFRFMSAQLRRDAEKYEATCQARSEAGKKGGAPKGNRNAAKIRPEKQAKQPEPVPVPEPVPESEPDPDPVPVCEPAPAREDAPHTAHTAKASDALGELPTTEDILTLSRNKGYGWTREEAEKFLAYNRDRHRTDGWEFAAERWQDQMQLRLVSKLKAAASTAADAKMQQYLSLSNRF